MDEFLLPILIAASVGAIAWAVARVAATAAAGSKRKIKQRLSLEQRQESATPIFKSLRVQQEAGGVAGTLGRAPVLQTLHHRLSQAFPEVTLGRFLMIMATTGLLALLFMTLL